MLFPSVQSGMPQGRPWPMGSPKAALRNIQRASLLARRGVALSEPGRNSATDTTSPIQIVLRTPSISKSDQFDIDRRKHLWDRDWVRPLALRLDALPSLRLDQREQSRRRIEGHPSRWSAARIPERPANAAQAGCTPASSAPASQATMRSSVALASLRNSIVPRCADSSVLAGVSVTGEATKPRRPSFPQPVPMAPGYS